MRSWPAPPVPRLPGQAVALRLHDTAAGELRLAGTGPVARLYVCGITPYDATHLGHAATYLAFDMAQRVWLDNGRDLHYVQNVTDVDDPLLERAVDTGEDWRKLARRETETFRHGMAALRMLPPRDFVPAVEAIPEIVAIIQQLLDSGAAYRLEDADIYFSIAAEPRFGAIGHYDTATMLALAEERGGDPGRPGKKDPLDPLLWRAARPGEPSWDGPLGAGRPGWHVECTAIAVNRLGMGFDVQGGGSDLVFPHHECSAAQAQVVTGQWPFARHYVHAGMVGLAGEKMSKSRGNLVLVSQLLARGIHPAAIRLALLAGHYRADRMWRADLLDEAAERLDRWLDALGRPVGPDARGLLDAVRRRLADDLDTPGALSAVDDWAHATLAGTGHDPAAPALARQLLDALLGIVAE